MIYHMLRRELGDDAFTAALRAFWQQFRFRSARYSDLANAFSAAAHQPLQALDPLWWERPGAPLLHLEEAQVEAVPGGFMLRVLLSQQSESQPYPLWVPLVVQLADGNLRREVLPLLTEREEYRLPLAERPLRIDLDPDFDLFRLLHPDERPSALQRLFGSQSQLLVLPGDAAKEVRAAWKELADAWQRRYRNVEVRFDTELERVPEDRAVWMLGWENRLLPATLPRLQGAGQQLTVQALQVGDQVYPRADVLPVVLDPDNTRAPLGFIGADTPAEISSLARKLTHYGRFGRLVFDRRDVGNLLKQKLPVGRSSLSLVFAATDPGPPPLRKDALVATQ
jgi:hypothetical protein